MSEDTQPGSETTARLFLVENHAQLRQGLCDFVNRQSGLTVVGESDSGEEAIPEIGRLLPELVLMDISLNGMSGIEATRRITGAWPQVKVLALSLHADPSYLRQMLDAGASGYVSKISPVEVLREAIRSTLSGQVYIDPSFRSSLENPRELPVAAPVAHGQALSEREQSVITQLAQGYSNKEIAGQLDISLKYVETLKTRIMRKLALESRIDLIRYASAQGWLKASAV